MLEHLPRRAIAGTPPRRPLFTIVRHTGRRALEHVRETLTAPRRPLRCAPVLTVDRLVRQAIGLGTIAPRAEIEPAHRSRRVARRRRQAMIEAEQPSIHARTAATLPRIDSHRGRTALNRMPPPWRARGATTQPPAR